jgi:hypothetical protein
MLELGSILLHVGSFRPRKGGNLGDMRHDMREMAACEGAPAGPTDRH